MDTNSSSGSKEPAPSPAEIRSTLNTLLAKPNLRLSERNRRFLGFIVSEALEGRSDRIKAYSIAVDVFGRSEDFDPAIDPIVRIEATRLRTALSAYYDGAGRADPIRILVPPGSYVPVFEHNHAGPPADDAARAFAHRTAAQPHAAALVIKHVTNPRDACGLVRGGLVIDTVMARLARLGLRVFSMPPRERKAAAGAIRELLRHPESVFALDIAVHAMAEGRRYAWSVTDLRSGEIRSTDFLDRADDGAPGATLIDELAEAAVRSVLAALP